MEKDPVCGAPVPESAPDFVESGGRRLRFCSPACAEKFRAAPAAFTGPEDPLYGAHMKVQDPVCGAVFTQPEAADYSFYQGKTFFFCSARCKQAFEREPSRYGGKLTHVDA